MAKRNPLKEALFGKEDNANRGYLTGLGSGLVLATVFIDHPNESFVSFVGFLLIAGTIANRYKTIRRSHAK